MRAESFVRCKIVIRDVCGGKGVNRLGLFRDFKIIVWKMSLVYFINYAMKLLPNLFEP